MATTRYSIVPTLRSVTAVTAGASYVGSVSVAVDIAGRNCYAKFYWYDSTYKFLSTSSLTGAVVSTGAFAWQRLTTQQTAPAGAAYAGIVPEIQDPTGGASCEFYVDQHKITGSVYSSGGPRPWQSPRQINITLEPNIINEMQNPSFSDATNPLWGWRVSGPGTSIASNSSISLNSGISMDVTSGGWLPGDLVGQLCCGAHTLSSVALYLGSDTAKPPITTLEADTDYTISAWVLPRNSYLPIRISFSDGVGEYAGSATPVLNVWQVPASPWIRISTTMRTSASNVGSGRISIGYFTSDINGFTPAVNPTTSGQSTWTPWTNPPAHYRGLWRPTNAYNVGDVISVPFRTHPAGAYFATALVANTSVDPDTDVSQTTWSRFQLYQTATIGVTSTSPPATGPTSPFYLDGDWSDTIRFRGDKLGLAVEYPVGSGTTYCMVKPSLIFGASNTLPMESHEFLVDAVQVQKGKLLTEFFDGDVPSPDYLWEGARYNSRSFYYQNRRSGQERLERIIKNYVPFGTPIQINYSQGAVTNL